MSQRNNQFYYHTDHLGSATLITDDDADVVQQIAYLPYGEDWIDVRSSSYFGSAYKFNGKEKDDETGYNYYGARYYTDRLSIWLSVDPLADKYPHLSPYAYCSDNPIMRIDPDGMADDWYESASGNITWTDCKSQQELDANGIKGTYLGQAHVVFNGSRRERPSVQNRIIGEGAVNASVTVYGPKGADDIHNFTGYTMTSNPKDYVPIDEGLFSLDYMNPGKWRGSLTSHWGVNKAGKVMTMDGIPNSNLETKGEWNYMTTWKTGIYVHSTGNNGELGKRNSTGCLMILDSQWNDFNKVMQGVTKSSVRVTRTDFQLTPLQGVTGVVPNVYIQQKITRR